MSKKKIYKKIWKGRFYHIHEGSPTGHPGMIYWKNDKNHSKTPVFLQKKKKWNHFTDSNFSSTFLFVRH